MRRRGREPGRGRFGRRPPFGRFGRMLPMRRQEHKPLPNRVHRELRKANRLSEQGDHLNAAAIFERLAVKALDRGMDRHGPMLLLQAAQAYILAEEIEKGIDLAKQGIEILANNQRFHKIRIIGERVVETLSSAGYKTEAENIQSWIENMLLATEEDGASKGRSKRQLPPKCPYCGATVRSDEVSWIDKNSAECVYCGSAVPAK